MTDDGRRKLAALAENLVLASPKDPSALAALHLLCKEIGEAWRGDGEREVAAACAFAMELLERLVLAESTDPAADLEHVSEAVALLQAVILEGVPASELRLPKGMSSAGGAGDGAGRGGPDAEDATDPDPGLLADFVQESREHLDNADLKLMTLETDPGDSESINAVFRAFHTIKGVAGFLGLKAVQAFAHETEDLLDKARQGRLALTSALLDVIFASVDALKKRVEWLAAQGGAPYPAEAAGAMAAVRAKVKAASEGRPTGDAPPELPEAGRNMRLGDILVASGAATREAVGEALRGQEIAEGREVEPGGGSAGKPPIGEVLVKQAAASPRDVALALRSQKQANDGGGALVKETVKVEAERLDRLLDAIGELVIAESMIFQNPELKTRRSPALSHQMAQLDKITRELQKMGTSLRMVPIRPVFQKMARLVRDLSRKGGKEVEFVASGEETELDKTVVDKIGDPLIHMVRNSVDHGIEPDAAARIEAGKPAQARVGLRAFQKGGSVCIQIHDDGRGLNREAILRKARERGLLKDDGASLSDQDVWRFIFEAGFSTAARVTEISGRGVGMDVVRRNIEELRGRIEIESRSGEGTTFSIWLPLTLAIIDGMIVRLGAERFVFPTLSILRIVPLVPEEIRTVEGRGEMLLLQGELVPILSLEGILPGRAAAAGDRGLVIIVETGGSKAGVRVDELLGQQQVVIKGLGETLNQVPGLAGGAILSDGTVGLILDVDGLIRAMRAEPATK